MAELALDVASWLGWDLLRLKIRRAPVPWDMGEIASGFLSGRESVLDAGCGSGQLMRSLSRGLRRGIGIDISKERVQYARLSTPLKLRSRLHFTRGSAHAVPAPDGAFHVVLSRHAPLFPEEIDRVLSSGGVVVAQQIGDEDARAVREAFEGSAEGRSAGHEIAPQLGAPEAVKHLREIGYTLARFEEYDVPLVFGDAASFLFWLQKVRILTGFDASRDAPVLLDLIDRLGTPNGIVTNEHRRIVVMQKPQTADSPA